MLLVTALGEGIGEARDRAYENVRRIEFDGAHYRTDIAARAVVQPRGEGVRRREAIGQGRAGAVTDQNDGMPT